MFSQKKQFPWKVPVMILVSVVVLGTGIYIGSNTKENEETNVVKTNEEDNNVAKETFELSKECEIWLEREDGSETTNVMLGRIPEELTNKTEEEITTYLTEKYPDRNIERISKYEIVLSEKGSSSSSDKDESKAGKYTIEADEELIKLYKYDDKGNRKVLQDTEINVESLPQVVQDEIKQGLVVDTEEEAYSRLEDFGS